MMKFWKIIISLRIEKKNIFFQNLKFDETSSGSFHSKKELNYCHKISFKNNQKIRNNNKNKFIIEFINIKN